MKKIIFFMLVFSVSTVFSQKNDFIWVLGYNYDPATPETENILMDFNGNEMEYTYVNKNVKILNTNVSFSDNDGNLLLYSNGCRFYTPDNEIVLNSDSLNIGYGYREFCSNLGGYNTIDNGVLLPIDFEYKKIIYFSDGVFYQWQPVFIGYYARLSYNTLELDPLTQSWAMSEKNVPILHDTVSGGHIEAVRHANGRDWWVIVSQFNTNLYYMYYISPYGVELYRTQNIGNPTTYQTGLNQAVFSPDGTKYCRYNNIDDLFIFDFDRCEGVLSNFKYVEVNDTTIPGGPLVVNANGLSISPNSRYLYLSNGFDLMQYDLNSDDPAITRQDVAHYNLWANYEALVFSQLGPDGKIYITTGNGTRHMHIVHNPDEFGLACNPQISAIVFDVAKNNAPNMPNYRLGPVDGSTCDSLGLDNLPWAHWRWQPDTFALRTVLFRDLSAYEPTAWHWDFGDGGSSAEQHPAHTFPAPGDYTVCLVASNSFGADTFCRVVTVSAVGADEVFRGLRASLAPNPAQDHVGLRLSEPLARACRFELFDPSGRLALSESLAPGTVTARVDLPESLPAGLYFWRIVNGGRVLVAGRVVKALR